MTGGGGEGGGRPLRGRGEWWRPSGQTKERKQRGKGKEVTDGEDGKKTRSPLGLKQHYEGELKKKSMM